jgi:hypothetical protein
MNDATIFQCIGIGLLIGLSIGYGAAMRWATIHLRQKFHEQADRICFEYAQDRAYMAECLRAAGVLPFDQVNARTSANAPDTGI